MSRKSRIGEPIKHFGLSAMLFTYFLVGCSVPNEATKPEITSLSTFIDQSKSPGSTVSIPSFLDTEHLWIAPAGTISFVLGPTMTRCIDNATKVMSLPYTPGTYYLYLTDTTDTKVMATSNSALTVTSDVPASLYGGNIYRVFADSGYSNRPTVSKYSNGQWSTVGTPGFASALNFEYPPPVQMVMGQNDGRVYVFGTEGSHVVRLWQWDGNAWSKIFDDNKESFYPNMFVTLDGTKYLVYKDNASGFGLRMTRISPDNTIQTTISLGTDVDYGSSMTVENGIVYYAYAENVSPYRLKVLKYDTSLAFNASNAVIVGGVAATTTQIKSPAIAVRRGVIFVAYCNVASSDKLAVVKYDGTGWSQVGSAGLTAGAITSFRGAGTYNFVLGGKYQSVGITLDTNYNVYVAYEDATSNSGNVLKYDGTSWSTVVSNFSTQLIEPDLIVDNGELIITHKKPDKTGVSYYKKMLP